MNSVLLYAYSTEALMLCRPSEIVQMIPQEKLMCMYMRERIDGDLIFNIILIDVAVTFGSWIATDGTA